MIKSAILIAFILMITLALPDAKANPTLVKGSAGDRLIVQMYWHDAVDLDLFLTDPRGETVYFANRIAKSGMKMGQRTGCQTIDQQDSPYSETIEIPVALPGRYRVSVDFIKDCQNSALKADFKIILKNKTGLELGSNQSVVKYRLLNPVAWEFIVK